VNSSGNVWGYSILPNSASSAFLQSCVFSENVTFKISILPFFTRFTLSFGFDHPKSVSCCRSSSCLQLDANCYGRRLALHKRCFFDFVRSQNFVYQRKSECECPYFHATQKQVTES
jgi:hypothetical protein